MGEEIWLDPNHDEATAGASTLVLACMPALGIVTNIWQNGTMSPKQAFEVSPEKSC
jgi:exosome complex component MTR3